MKLTLAGFAALAALAAAVVGGCAARESNDWAQTAPVIAPEADDATVSLGASER